MMGEFLISGNEGAVYSNAEALSPSCYRGQGGRGYTCTSDCGATSTTQTPTHSPTHSPTHPITTAPTVSQPITTAPTVSQPSAVSELSCAELGWNNAEDYGSDLVCGWSRVNGVCSDLIDWSSAVSFCEDGGARLCTVSELEADETLGTGCGFNRELLWSSTPCGTGAYSLAMGRALTFPSPQCEDSSSLHYTRCCADVAIRRSIRRRLDSPRTI